ncbi:hypothetical protein K439DRAFT_1639020 [Ramaria rubella]|nr:hypothetical protein K439DRAFT_1639020 [Ramaria rubella]
MPRIPYVFPEVGESPIADKIRERRDGKLRVLDGMLLNAPPIASGYNSLMAAVRTESTLEGGVREALMLRVAALNSAAYEWIAHEPIGRAAGLTDEQIAAIRDVSYVRSSEPRPPPSPVLSPVLAAALAYTDAMTVTVKVPQEVFDALKIHLDNRKMFEVTATIASYNMVSRILVAMDVNDMADTPVPHEGRSP